MPLEFVDPTMRESCSSDEVMRCMHLGLLCVQGGIDDRPSMELAVLVLHTDSYTLPTPQEPVFAFSRSRELNIPEGISSDHSTNKSANSITVTDVNPR